MNSFKITDVRSHPGDSAFLIDNGKTALLYDSGFGFTGYAVAQNIKNLLGNRPLDGILLTHSHYDHALGSAYVKKVYPEAKVVAGEYAAKIFAKPTARTVMRDLDKKFAVKCGVEIYEDLTDTLSVDITVSEGDKVSFGDICLTAISLPGHTKCSVGYYIQENNLLLSCETIGVYGGENIVVPSFLVGVEMTFSSIKRVLELNLKSILVPHFGLLEGKAASDYLKCAQESAKSVASDIADILKKGGTHSEALEFFRNKFYHGYIKTIYPEDAMELNTKIMIALVEKELQ